VTSSDARAETVVKVGGGLLENVELFDAVMAAVGEAGRSSRLLVVPGGGPFADTVRRVDERLALPDAAAHWMAVLAMDQFAQLIAARLGGAMLIAYPGELAAAAAAGRVPVLAPFRWLRDVDPLPHSWDVTSDSIAAWVAGQLGARQLVLVKPPGVQGLEDAVDVYFERARPPDLATRVVAADRIEELRLVLLSKLM